VRKKNAHPSAKGVDIMKRGTKGANYSDDFLKKEIKKARVFKGVLTGEASSSKN